LFYVESRLRTYPKPKKFPLDLSLNGLTMARSWGPADQEGTWNRGDILAPALRAGASALKRHTSCADLEMIK